MYYLIKIASFLFRLALCTVTVNLIPIFSSTDLVESIISEAIPIHSIMMLVSYKITRIFYNPKYDPKEQGSIIYFFIYVLVVLPLTIWILLDLTKKGMLPILG